MELKSEKHGKKIRVARPQRLPKKSWIDEAVEFQERILMERGGELLPDSTEDIRAMREGKLR